VTGERAVREPSEPAVCTVRVRLPYHLRTLAKLEGEVAVQVLGTPTTQSVIDALETAYPMLRGTIRDHGSGQRRAFLRIFACGRDLSHEAPDAPLPAEVVAGREPFIVLGAIAGG
jgi:hypothetical protein